MTIQAVDMVRNIRNDYYDLIKDMSLKERKEFFRQKAAILKNRIDSLSNEKQGKPKVTSKM